MIVRQVALFPQPDSPTIPSVVPFSTEKLTPSTARTTPSRVLNDVRRFSTWRRVMVFDRRKELRQRHSRVGDRVEDVHNSVDEAVDSSEDEHGCLNLGEV